MELISVDSAKRTDGTAIELAVTYTDDAGVQRSDPYGWVVGDIYGLGPQIDAWMAARPDFPIADYVPPVITAAQVADEAQRRFMIATADARALNQVLGTPIPAAIVSLGQAIIAKGNEISAMTPIPTDFAADRYWI